MPNISFVKSKFFEPQAVDDNGVSTSGTAATLVIADGGPYGNLTQIITIKSAGGNNTGNEFTITGTDGNGDALTEDVTGPGSGLTVNSTERYLTITSIVSDGAIVTDIQAGWLGTGTGTGTIFGGRTRVRGMQGVGKAAAGNVLFKNTSITGTTLLTVPTVADTAMIEPYIPDNGVLFKAGAFISIPYTAVTGLTVFYDG